MMKFTSCARPALSAVTGFSLIVSPLATQAQAADTPAPPSAAQPAPVVKSPVPAVTPPPPIQAVAAPAADNRASSFVKCDGNPNKPSALGTAARLVAITAVVGLLLPQREAPDATKRLTGAEGIKACTDALTGSTRASDGGRRIELILARAIHRMEVSDWDGAIADIHSIPTDQPALSASRAYGQSLGLAALYFETLALVGKGDLAAAQKLGLEMGARAPYDLPYMYRASAFADLQGSYTPEQASYYDQLVRMKPVALNLRAAALARAGRFADSGDDYKAMAAVLRSVPQIMGYVIEQREAISYRLAGRGAEADALMAHARGEADADAAAGRNPDLTQAMAEGADFDTILTALDGGQTVRARNIFSAHSHWESIAVGDVAEVARRLRGVGTAAEQSASPIKSPEQILSDDTKRLVAGINFTGDGSAPRWNAFIPAFDDGDFDPFARNVWRTDKSRYVADTPNVKWNGTFITTERDGVGVPSAYALLMHLALLSKAQGKAGFMLLPGQTRVFQAFFRIGNPDGKDITPAVLFNADKVIADLGPYLPKPVPGK